MFQFEQKNIRIKVIRQNFTLKIGRIILSGYQMRLRKEKKRKKTGQRLANALT